MPLVPFDQLPASARLWIFPASRPLDPRQQQELLGNLDGFLGAWAAHGAPLAVARELRHDQFLMIGVDESAAAASGCSIDSLVRHVKTLEGALDITLTDHSEVIFRKGSAIVRASRPDFADLARRNEVSPDTIVFNNSLTNVSALLADQWEVRAAQSWHGTAFFRRPLTTSHAAPSS